MTLFNQQFDRSFGKSIARTWESMLYKTLRIVLNRPIRMMWLKRVRGLEHVPVSGGAILASNHESYLDFIIVPVSGCRLPCYMVGEIFFEKPVIGRAFRTMGFIPVDRRRDTNTEAVRAALRRLRANDLLGVFPEGTRSAER